MVQKPVWQPSPPHVFVLCADVTNGEQHEAKVDSAARVRRFSRERRWFVLERPRRDTNGGSETKVTVTSKLPSKYRSLDRRSTRRTYCADFCYTMYHKSESTFTTTAL